jgi:peptide/nickel transport system substrate-binding protein
MDFIANPDRRRAHQLLMESGYDGTPVVVMLPTDQPTLRKLPAVAAQLLREAGFKVDLQSMDWESLVERRARKDGWNIFITGAVAVNVKNPVSSFYLSGACDKAWPGWPCDPELERLRDAFARAGNDESRKMIAEQVQVQAMKIGAYVPLGEYVIAKALRKTVTGLLPGYNMVLWNVEKQ